MEPLADEVVVYERQDSLTLVPTYKVVSKKLSDVAIDYINGVFYLTDVDDESIVVLSAAMLDGLVQATNAMREYIKINT